jgi:tetratricopeptide (TPR) repeat protein
MFSNRLRILVAGAIVATVCGVACVEAAPQGRGGDMTSREQAESLHEKGREAGQRGNHEEAIALFTEAAALAPEWPAPVYDRAYTQLLAENPSAALADYRRTLDLAPRGFFTAHVAVDTLRREQLGEFPAGLYLAYVMLEQMPAEQRRQTITQLVDRVPNFAPGWQQFATLAATPQQRLERLDAGLKARPDAETRGMLQLNQAMVLRELGQHSAAEAILRDVAGNANSTLNAQALAKKLLAQTAR